MGDKQRKLKDKASRAYADGKLKDALKLYVRVVEEDPSELGCQLKIGDIHRRLGNRDAAVDAYLPVARAYADDGLLLKAIAVCKMILAVDSDHGPTQALLRDLSQKRRGPPEAVAPVTLHGMGISPTPRGGADQFADYGMVELDPTTSGQADVQVPGAMRMVDPAELGAKPAVVTGKPVAPPSGTPVPNVSWPAAGPSPAGAATPSAAPRPAWPAAGQTPPPSLSWPQAAPPSPPSDAPKIVVGERLEDSALDITVGADVLDSGPEQASQPPPKREALAEAAARQVEAEMAQMLSDAGAEAEAPAGPPTELELPEDEAPPVHDDTPVTFEESEEDDDPSALELDLDDDTDLEAAMAAAVAGVDAEAASDEPLELELPVEAPPAGTPESPIELTDVIDSVDLAPKIELSKHSEDIDAAELPSGEIGDELSKSNIPLFSDLPKNAFLELLVHMDMRELAPGDVVIEEGEVGDSFFVLVSGKVRVQRRDDQGQDVVLAYLTEGAFFGEMALLQDGARTATVAAETESQIFEISRDVLDRVVSHYPSVANVLRNFYRQRLLSTTMATHPLFRPFSVDERRSLMEQFKSRSFKKGDVLVEEDKKGTGLFLLLYGSLEVVKSRDEASPKVLAELASGDLFGEMSLLTGKPTMATVRAISDCFVLRLGKKKFDEIIMTHPQILELVSTISDERQGLNDLILAQGVGTGAVLV